MLVQQKSNSWTLVGPAKDRASNPHQFRWKFLGRYLTKFPTPPVNLFLNNKKYNKTQNDTVRTMVKEMY